MTDSHELVRARQAESRWGRILVGSLIVAVILLAAFAVVAYTTANQTQNNFEKFVTSYEDIRAEKARLCAKPENADQPVCQEKDPPATQVPEVPEEILIDRPSNQQLTNMIIPLLPGAVAAYCNVDDRCVGTGRDGEDGKDGRDGEDGAPGAQGEQGEQGIPGTAAEKGDKGDTGEQGPQGEPGPACPDGYSPTPATLITQEGIKNVIICEKDT